jgi:hypothetical protein
MRKKLNSPYFPQELKYGSVLFLVGGIYLAITGHLVWGPGLIVLGLILFSTEYVTEFDVQSRRITDYLSCCWLRFNKDEIRYGAIDKIIIVKSTFAQTINTRVQSRQMDWKEFTARILFDQNDPFDLLTKRTKHDLLLAIKELTLFLKVDVEDLTTSQPYFIDVSRIE